MIHPPVSKRCMLVSLNWTRIFRGGVRTQQRDRSSPRPTPLDSRIDSCQSQPQQGRTGQYERVAAVSPRPGNSTVSATRPPTRSGNARGKSDRGLSGPPTFPLYRLDYLLRLGQELIEALGG